MDEHIGFRASGEAFLRGRECPSRVNSSPSAAPPRRSVPGGRADEIRVKADFGARMSVAGDERSYLGHSWNRRL
jgi:hypothetical protein